MSKTVKRKLSATETTELIAVLKVRFAKNMNRHKGIDWAKVETRLKAKVEKCWSLNQMEKTGGEPDVVGHDKKTGEFIFFDCSAETPKNRRSVCYDHEALEARKEHKPENSAIAMAEDMGVDVLTEEQYFELQKLGSFDCKSSSWIKTPADIRKKDGALYGESRFGRVFIGANGAQSYYSVRAFRGMVKV